MPVKCKFITFVDYVEEIYQTCVEALINKTLVDAADELAMMSPEPMNTMLEKQDRNEAIQKRTARKQLLVEDVPGTCNGN